MFEHLSTAIFLIGLGQLSVLVASALVPIRLKWQSELLVLPRLHRQLYWVYGGYTVLAIISLGLVCLTRFFRFSQWFAAGRARSAHSE